MKSVKYNKNLRTTTPLGSLKLLPLLTGGRFSEAPLYSKCLKRNAKIVLFVDRGSLFEGGHYPRLDSKFNFRESFKIGGTIGIN